MLKLKNVFQWHPEQKNNKVIIVCYNCAVMKCFTIFTLNCRHKFTTEQTGILTSVFSCSAFLRITKAVWNDTVAVTEPTTNIVKGIYTYKTTIWRNMWDIRATGSKFKFLMKIVANAKTEESHRLWAKADGTRLMPVMFVKRDSLLENKPCTCNPDVKPDW